MLFWLVKVICTVEEELECKVGKYVFGIN